ncbi:MAG: hypothetical protein AB1Z66_11975 [Candidatus Limnocylindrales bacterium]
MNKNTRVTAIVGTTMALMLAGTAAVSAAGPRDRDDMRGFGGQGMPGRPGMGPMNDGPLMGGMRMGAGLRGLDADVERVERTVQTADGTTTLRVERGVVDTATGTSLSFTLGSGEMVSVVVDDDTDAFAYEEQEVISRRGWSRTRLAPTEVELMDIAAGAEIVVWSNAEDDAGFVASRVMVQPADSADAADEAETTEEAVVEAAATDA